MTDAYCKAFASIEDIEEEKDYGPHGGFTAVLSTPSEDRDGDQLYRDEWKEFTQERYPLDMDHGMSVAQTIGSFRPFFDGEKMMMEAHFAGDPESQRVRGLVTPDPVTGIRHIQSVSVAFMMDKTKKSGEPKRELLNAGIVAIPSNRDAVILASKAANALKDAFSDATEGEVPEEVKKAVLEILTDHKDVEDVEEKPKGIYVDIIPRLDETALKSVFTELFTKASATASGIGGDGALVQAIHDASSHLGAGCPVIEVTDEGSGADDGANKDLDQDTFTKALDEALKPEETPAEEEPAPADEAAAASDDAAESQVKKKRARELELIQMRAKSIRK